MKNTDTPRTDAFPHCGCQTKDPFGMRKTIHNVENCKRNRQLAAPKGQLDRLRETLKKLSEMPEYDQDDAHRLRHGAKITLNFK